MESSRLSRGLGRFAALAEGGRPVRRGVHAQRTRGYVANFRSPPDITVSFGAAQYTASEGGAAATVTVHLSDEPGR